MTEFKNIYIKDLLGNICIPYTGGITPETTIYETLYCWTTQEGDKIYTRTSRVLEDTVLVTATGQAYSGSEFVVATGTSAVAIMHLTDSGEVDEEGDTIWDAEECTYDSTNNVTLQISQAELLARILHYLQEDAGKCYWT